MKKYGSLKTLLVLHKMSLPQQGWCWLLVPCPTVSQMTWESHELTLSHEGFGATPPLQSKSWTLTKCAKYEGDFLTFSSSSHGSTYGKARKVSGLEKLFFVMWIAKYYFVGKSMLRVFQFFNYP